MSQMILFTLIYIHILLEKLQNDTMENFTNESMYKKYSQTLPSGNRVIV
jgi:hypothetical protein